MPYPASRPSEEDIRYAQRSQFRVVDALERAVRQGLIAGDPWEISNQGWALVARPRLARAHGVPRAARGRRGHLARRPRRPWRPGSAGPRRKSRLPERGTLSPRARPAEDSCMATPEPAAKRRRPAGPVAAAREDDERVAGGPGRARAGASGSCTTWTPATARSISSSSAPPAPSRSRSRHWTGEVHAKRDRLLCGYHDEERTRRRAIWSAACLEQWLDEDGMDIPVAALLVAADAGWRATGSISPTSPCFRSRR